MPKRTKNKKSPSRKGTLPIDFDASTKNNPLFHLCIVFLGQTEITSTFPYQEIPGNTFRLGVESDSIHHVAQEALRSVLQNGIAQFLTVNSSIQELIKSYVDTYYAPNTTGNGYFQFNVGTDTTLRTFKACSNFLSNPTPGNKKPHVMFAKAPECIFGMIQQVVASQIKDKPDDKFFDTTRKLLPPEVVQAYDSYLSTPEKSRKFELFSHALYLEPSGCWRSPFEKPIVIYTATTAPHDPRGNTSSPRPPASSPPPSGNQSNSQSESGPP